MTNETAATLISIASSYRANGRALPDHLRADLSDVAKCDSIAHSLRNDAARLLETR